MNFSLCISRIHMILSDTKMERKTVIIATQVHLFIFPHSGSFVPATKADEHYQLREHSPNHTQWLVVFILHIRALGQLTLHTCRDAHILVSTPTHVYTDASACFCTWLVNTAAANMGIAYILIGWRFQPPRLFSKREDGWTTRQFFSDTTGAWPPQSPETALIYIAICCVEPCPLSTFSQVLYISCVCLFVCFIISSYGIGVRL